jgi:hypothetical protein
MTLSKTTMASYRKICEAIKNSKSKYVTAESLALEVGLFPEKISDLVSIFDPLASIDFSFDLRKILSALDLFANGGRSEKKAKTQPKNKTPYELLNDFVYEKMTFSGVLDKSVILTDKDLRQIRVLAMNEIKARKAASKK